MTFYLRRPQINRPRARVLAQSGKPCTYCAKLMDEPTRDHVMPAHRGYRLGDFGGWNRAWVCNRCNNDKKHHNVFQWLDRLEKGGDPRAPTVARFVARFLAAVPWTEQQLRNAATAGMLYSAPAVTTIGEAIGDPVVRAVLKRFPGAAVVKIVKNANGPLPIQQTLEILRPKPGLVLRGGYWVEK